MAKHEGRYCLDCFKAKIFQYEYDPVIAECNSGERFVASFPVLCDKFKKFPTHGLTKEQKFRCIENRPKKIGLELIMLKYASTENDS